MPSEQMIQKYAALAVEVGIHLKKGQLLAINAPVECAPFVRACVRAAFEAGAKDVRIFWKDETVSALRFRHGDRESVCAAPEWEVEARMEYIRQGAGWLSISASDPSSFAGVDTKLLQEATRNSEASLREFSAALMSNENPWCVVSVPTEAWAKRVFPESADPVEELWNAIFKAIRLDEADPVAAWQAHQARLAQKSSALNARRYQALHYRNSLGTDLIARLPEGHIWCGGQDRTRDGWAFTANMPTEEIFTAPHREGVDGVLYSTLPLNHQGTLIDGIRLVFEKGKVVEYSARTGEEALGHLLDTDEGARHLGEMALVPCGSPISKMGILFYNTLFDENASCHFALGEAYSECVEGGNDLPKDELLRRGLNDSLIHVDFMVGTDDLSILGVKADGTEEPVFENGRWAF